MQFKGTAFRKEKKKSTVTIGGKKDPAEKLLNHNAVAMEASANPLRSWGAGVAIQLY